MIKTILGTKSDMSSAYSKFGYQVPVTTVMVEPNTIIGMHADRITLGLGKKKKSKKTENAFIKVAGHSPRFIKEIKENQQTGKKVNLGDKVTVSIFEVGDEVKVTGTTKGKGFAGSVKRWGFAGGPKTHGQSDRHRAPGSIGMGTTPGRVFKGKKMAGHMGNAKLTVTGLEIIEVNEGKNLLLVKGAIPGPKDGFLIIEKTGKVKSYTPPPPPSGEKQAVDPEVSGQRAEKEAAEEKAETKQQTSDPSGSSDTSVTSEKKEKEDAKK